MPGILQMVRVGKTPTRIQTLLVSNVSFMLVNPDIVNNIFIGNDPGSQPIAVPALGSVTLDASKHDVWVSTNGGAFTVDAYLMPNGSNWVPSPAQVAAQINALGLAKDTTLQSTNTKVDNTTNTLNFQLSAGTNPAIQQLGGVAGRSVAQDMLNANQGATTEIAALVATGTANGTPGGVPLLRNTKQLAQQTTEFTITAGAVKTVVNSLPTNQPSYEMAMTFRYPTNAGTIPFGEVLIEWFDAVTGIAMDIASFVIAGGNNQQIFFNIYGPNRGDLIFVQITNLDPAQSLFATWVVNATSHVHERDKLLQPSYQSNPPNGFNNPAGDPTTGLIAAFNASIPSAGTVTRLIAACNGLANLMIDNGGTANDLVVILSDPGPSLYSTNNGARFYVLRLGAGLRSPQNEIALPHGNLLLTLTNTNSVSATAITPNVALIKKDLT